jgi:hypothetical protein
VAAAAPLVTDPAPAPPAPADAVSAAKPASRVVVPRPLPAGTPGPAVERDGDRATAVVPIEGSTTGMIHYSLTHPRGLAVNLPFARSSLPLGLHALHHDGFRFVWLRELPEGGLQVRFIFAQPPPDERVLDVEDQAVKVRVALSDSVATSSEP